MCFDLLTLLARIGGGMTDSNRIIALDLPLRETKEHSPELRGALEYLEKEHGLVPNFVRAYSFDETKLKTFMDLYNEVMLGESELTMLEREMIGVAVSVVNQCYYCLTSHGAAVRLLSGDPVLGDQIATNYRFAPLDLRHRAMLDFAVKITRASYTIGEADRQSLRHAGFSDRGIFDIAAVAGIFNYSNRMASALDIRPNEEYHYRAREKPAD